MEIVPFAPPVSTGGHRLSFSFRVARRLGIVFLFEYSIFYDAS